MISPEIDSRVKETYESTGDSINTGDVGPFVKVAVGTGECQVFWDCFPTVFLGYDMVDLKRGRED